MNSMFDDTYSKQVCSRRVCRNMSLLVSGPETCWGFLVLKHFSTLTVGWNCGFFSLMPETSVVNERSRELNEITSSYDYLTQQNSKFLKFHWQRLEAEVAG